MSAADLEDLVSQSEKMGITLAEMISKSLSAEQIEELQSELGSRIAEGYKGIEDFMSDVSVPSIEELMVDEEYTPLFPELEDDLELSDESEGFVDYA